MEHLCMVDSSNNLEKTCKGDVFPNEEGKFVAKLKETAKFLT